MTGNVNTAKQFRVFLSHRYQAPAANLYFWSILSEVAEFQFEVDPALMPDGTRKPTNVTRLELLIRECDAFVGIFSQPEHSNADAIREETAYFRLETDLAIRSRKPTLLFIDHRYHRLFRVPSGFHIEWFNQQEIESPGVSPSRSRFNKTCAEFCNEVLASKSHAVNRRERIDPHRAAIILGSQGSDSPYSPTVVDELCGVLAREYVTPSVLRYPTQGASFQLADLDSLRWCLVDVGDGLYRTGLVGYLHGRFVPQLRAFYSGNNAPNTIAEYRSLYVGIEKGYDSDLIRWDSTEALVQAVRKRLEVLFLEPTLIANSDAAVRYFSGASLRKDTIFLSYSGEDRGVAVDVGQFLRKRFQTVFDYREKGALVAGEHWPPQIEKAIESSAIGIQLISNNYFSSAHCKNEALMMEARRLGGRMVVLSIKIHEGEIKGMPLSQTLEQYIRLKDHATTEDLVEHVVKTIDKAA
jgi:hypothetical protein